MQSDLGITEKEAPELESVLPTLDFFIMTLMKLEGFFFLNPQEITGWRGSLAVSHKRKVPRIWGSVGPLKA